MSAIRWTDEILAKVVAFRKAGLTFGEIAKRPEIANEVGKANAENIRRALLRIYAPAAQPRPYHKQNDREREKKPCSHCRQSVWMSHFQRWCDSCRATLTRNYDHPMHP